MRWPRRRWAIFATYNRGNGTGWDMLEQKFWFRESAQDKANLLNSRYYWMFGKNKKPGEFTIKYEVRSLF